MGTAKSVITYDIVWCAEPHAVFPEGIGDSVRFSQHPSHGGEGKSMWQIAFLVHGFKCIYDVTDPPIITFLETLHLRAPPPRDQHDLHLGKSKCQSQTQIQSQTGEGEAERELKPASGFVATAYLRFVPDQDEHRYPFLYLDFDFHNPWHAPASRSRVVGWAKRRFAPEGFEATVVTTKELHVLRERPEIAMRVLEGDFRFKDQGEGQDGWGVRTRALVNAHLAA
ncbi:uncharacterized protein L3040_006313 [Drepanopeziza brunnea f. sp. 'multigermtubi']|uniref:uncharacterized protein n=1 Tax=Drepanopeziza brunnea f. sp. 'multigermtubi' TaxID=698441 RepID=UPI00239F1F4B|nr:hypothetical protein L3040_006313 [Drepanopeziza brunnea f. sp. 'multigermtubi']